MSTLHVLCTRSLTRIPEQILHIEFSHQRRDFASRVGGRWTFDVVLLELRQKLRQNVAGAILTIGCRALFVLKQFFQTSLSV